MQGRVAFVLGTRPEAIKLAPVILAARRSGRLAPLVISTGQHKDLVGSALETFGLAPHFRLDVMRPEQSLAELTSRTLAEVARVIEQTQPQLVVVQGDTATALAGAMAAFYARVPVAHVEAGLRTRDLTGPFPEEANRQMVSRLARLHFAPTCDAKSNLLSEGIEPDSIFVTGNTVVDAVELLKPLVRETSSPVMASARRLILVTAHRRENLGPRLESICSAVRTLADDRRDCHFAFVLHPNPLAKRTARQMLADSPHITLLPPLPYLKTLRLIHDSWLVLTDSGGLQEEAPSFHRPVLVLRDSTERVEGLTSGAARLVGTNTERIMDCVVQLIESPDEFARLVPADNPYGDGKSARRIVHAIADYLKVAAPIEGLAA